MTGHDRLDVWFGREYLAKGSQGQGFKLPAPKTSKAIQTKLDRCTLHTETDCNFFKDFYPRFTYLCKVRKDLCWPYLNEDLAIAHFFLKILKHGGSRKVFLIGTIKSVTIEIINMFCTFIWSKFQCAKASYSCSIRPVSNDPSPKP